MANYNEITLQVKTYQRPCRVVFELPAGSAPYAQIIVEDIREESGVIAIHKLSNSLKYDLSDLKSVVPIVSQETNLAKGETITVESLLEIITSLFIQAVTSEAIQKNILPFTPTGLAEKPMPAGAETETIVQAKTPTRATGPKG